MFKKYIVATTILISFFTLTACGEDTTDTTTETDFITTNYETANFQLNYPSDWEIIEKNKFSSSVPENTIVAFRSNLKNDLFTTNVNINLSILANTISSKDYGLKSLESSSQNLSAYQLLTSNEDTVTTLTGENTAFVAIFQGKKSPSDPVIKFTQLFVSTGSAVYTLTLASLPEEDETVYNKGLSILNSFTLKI